MPAMLVWQPVRAVKAVPSAMMPTVCQRHDFFMIRDPPVYLICQHVVCRVRIDPNARCFP